MSLKHMASITGVAAHHHAIFIDNVHN